MQTRILVLSHRLIVYIWKRQIVSGTLRKKPAILPAVQNTYMIKLGFSFLFDTGRFPLLWPYFIYKCQQNEILREGNARLRVNRGK